MGLTKREKMLEDFFKREVLPRKTAYFKRVDKPSCFIERKEQEIKFVSIESVGKSLEECWKGTRFQPLAKKLLKLAPAWKEVQKTEEVSPFIYEMF